MEALITTWQNMMWKKMNAYQRWYIYNTYVSNFPSLQKGLSPSLKQAQQRRKFKDRNKEEANKPVQKRQRKNVRGGNDGKIITTKIREMR